METNSNAQVVGITMFEVYVLGFLLFYTMLKWMRYWGIPENFPPGPPCVPFIGSVPFIKGNFKSSLEKWKEDYGDVVGLKLGGELTVILSDYDVINSAFKDDRVTGRPKNLRTIMSAFFSSNSSEEDGDRLGSGGIVFSHGAEWREQRRFALRNLRDQGMGKSYMESVILDEVRKLSKVLGFESSRMKNNNILDKRSISVHQSGSCLSNEIRDSFSECQKVTLDDNKVEDINKPLNHLSCDEASPKSKRDRNRKKSSTVNHHLSVAVVNSLWSILTGEKIAHGDERIKQIVRSTSEFIQQESLVGPLMVFPWLRHCPIISSKFKASKEHPLKMRKLQDETVNKRKLSRSIDYETSTLTKMKISSPNKQQHPTRRKTYAGNITWPSINNHFGENNNLEHFDGIDLVRGNNEKGVVGRKIPVYNQPNQEFIPELEEDDANDYIDVYLRKISKTRERKSSFFGDSGLTNLQRTLTELFGAGSETSATTLLFAFLYMIKFPDVQEKVQMEIDSTVGNGKGASNRPVGLDDRPLMSYTDATLHEILRHSCLVYAIPHSATENVRISSYDIPSGTAIYANLWAVMHDKYYWKDPNEFRPERFLDNDGQFRRDDRCVPFSLGKRYCIGQSLAQNSLFLFFTGILQRFRLEAPDGPDSVNIDPIVGFIHSCPLYDVDFVIRD